MKYIILIAAFIAFAYGLPIATEDDKKPIDGKLLAKAGKLLSVAAIAVEKNLKVNNNNNDDTSLVSHEEVVLSSTGYPTFNAFDQNSDGYIDFEEFASTDDKDHKSNFQRADTDGDHKLSPEEFSRLPLVVYEPEQFSDTDEEEPSVVFLTPPESILRNNEKEMNIRPDSGYADGFDIAEISVAPNDEAKEKGEFKEPQKDIAIQNPQINSSATQFERIETANKETPSVNRAKQSESSPFTAEDMPVKIDDEDDEMIEIKDEDIPVEVLDDFSQDEREHYDLDDMRDINEINEFNEINEDDRIMNKNINSID